VRSADVKRSPCILSIIRFLCASPPETNGWGKRLVRHRTTLGLTARC
jgi:hypothetical protein